MRKLVGFLVIFLWLVGLTTPVYAQDTAAPLPGMPVTLPMQELIPLDPVVLSIMDQQRSEWVREFVPWKKWTDEWRNRRQMGQWHILKRRPMPQPPEWLGDDCMQSLAESGSIFEACKLHRVATEELSVTLIRERINYAVTNHEALKKTLWWERVSIDGGWITPSYSPGPPVIGVFGAHVTLDLGEGRMGLFAGPGIMVVRFPNAFGGYDTKPSPDYGFSYRLKDFHVPGTHFSTRMSFSAVEVWIIGTMEGNVPFRQNLTLVGLSFSPRKTRS